MNTPELNPFQRWVAEMAEACGMALPVPLDPLGMELEVEGRLARILRHGDETLAVVEVDVLALHELDDDDLGAVATALLRLNEEARFEHGWTIVLDEQDQLSISRTLVMAATRAQALNEAVAEGLDRAVALAQGVVAMVDPAVTAQRRRGAAAGQASDAGAPASGSGFLQV